MTFSIETSISQGPYDPPIDPPDSPRGLKVKIMWMDGHSIVLIDWGFSLLPPQTVLQWEKQPQLSDISFPESLVMRNGLCTRNFIHPYTLVHHWPLFSPRKIYVTWFLLIQLKVYLIFRFVAHISDDFYKSQNWWGMKVDIPFFLMQNH